MEHTAPQPAMEFLHAIVSGEATAAWRLMDDTFRLAYAQAWAYEHGAGWDVAERISQAGPLDPLWPSVAAAILDGLRSTMDSFVELAAAGRLGLYSEVTPVGPDLEQVVFVDDHGATESCVAETSRPIEALRVFVRTTDQGQRVAGIKGSIPQPGWPPNMNARVDDAGWHRPSTMN